MNNAMIVLGIIYSYPNIFFVVVLVLFFCLSVLFCLRFKKQNDIALVEQSQGHCPA